MPRERIMAELLSSGRWEGELVRTKKDGAQGVVASRWSLQRDARGTPVAALETDDDINKCKRAEGERERLRQLEADLARINRVSMMGVSHPTCRKRDGRRTALGQTPWFLPKDRLRVVG